MSTLSFILLTHATASHLAAYAHCCHNFPLFTRIPVYATRPVIDFGRTLTQDLYASSPAAATTISEASISETAYAYAHSPAAVAAENLLLQAPTPDDIARYFSLIQPLKYSQPHQPLPSPFSPPLNGLTVTAYNSGHTLGGTIWHIQHGLESIVYAVDWNQARENVFAGAAWLGGAGGSGTEVIEQLRKPTALICSSHGSERNAQAGGRVRRDEHMLEMIKQCVSKGGTVLIPIDSSARVLELSYMLEHAWRVDAAANGRLHDVKLYLAGRNMSSTMRYARSMLEWMDDSIVQEFEAYAEGQRKTNGTSDKKDGGPFDFKFMRLLERKAQVIKLLSGDIDVGQGRVILASDTSLEWGFSKDIIRSLADDEKNLVILTDRPGVSKEKTPSIARTLWDWWKEKKHGVVSQQTASGETLEFVRAGGRDLTVREAEKKALNGDELNMYEQWLATQRQLQATQQSGTTTLETSGEVDDVSSESSSDSEDEDGQQQGKALTVSATLGQARKNVVLKDEDLGVSILIKKKGVYDFDSRGRKGRERSFPVAVRRKRTDDFGELIRPEDFLRAEEKEDEPVEGVTAVEDDGDVGKKRKWDEVATGSVKKQQPNWAASTEAPEGEESAPAELDELDLVEDSESQEPVGPSKLVYHEHTITAQMQIGFVDFSGLHDPRSLNMLIRLIQPRKLILVSGTQEETMALAEDCRTLLSSAAEGERTASDVFTPAVGAVIDASVDTNAWVVKLADPLVKKLRWQNVRGLGIVTISGQLLAAALQVKPDEEDDDQGPSKRQKTAEPALQNSLVAASAAMPILDVVPSHLASATRTVAQPLHVGDLRLPDLRRAMQAAGHAAEFRGEGILVVDGTVTIHKTGDGRIDVESVGLPGVGRKNALHDVRRAIYDNLAVVAGA